MTPPTDSIPPIPHPTPEIIKKKIEPQLDSVL